MTDITLNEIRSKLAESAKAWVDSRCATDDEVSIAYLLCELDEIDERIAELEQQVEWISVDTAMPDQFNDVLLAYDIHDEEPLLVGHFYLNNDNKWQSNEYCKHCDKHWILDEYWTPVKWQAIKPPKD